MSASKLLVLGVVALVGAQTGRGDSFWNDNSPTNSDPNRGSSEFNNGKFRNGQAIADAYTAGGTSKPCTGKYCQDNPLGNPCPCPVWKPCKHDNKPDGHCMLRVNQAGEDVWDDAPGAHVEHGTWSASMSGLVSTGKKPAGTIMCTAGSSDLYESVEWKKCDRKDPQWCSMRPTPTHDETVGTEKVLDVRAMEGNACPARDCAYYWSDWTQCSASCGGGRQTRSPLVEQQPKPAQKLCKTDDGKPCPAPKQCPVPQTRKCNLKACPKRVPTPAPTPGAAPTPAPYTPPACPDKKTKNRMEEAENNKAQVENMKEGLKASEDAQCARDTCSEQQNRVAETQNLLEERMNEHILTCDGVEGCREMSMESTHYYDS